MTSPTLFRNYMTLTAMRPICSEAPTAKSPKTWRNMQYFRGFQTPQQCQAARSQSRPCPIEAKIKLEKLKIAAQPLFSLKKVTA